MDKELFEQYQAQSNLQQEGTASQYALSPELQTQAQQITAIILQTLNPSRIVEDMLNYLQGKRYNYEGKLEQFSVPKVNEKGIEDIAYLMDGIVNQNQTMSDYEEIQIKNYMKLFSDDIILLVGTNWKRWGLTKSDKNMVEKLLITNVNSIFNRAKNGGERNKTLKTTVEFLTSASQMQSKGGLLKNIKDKLKL